MKNNTSNNNSMNNSKTNNNTYNNMNTSKKEMITNMKTVAIVFAIAFTFGFVGVTKADAQATNQSTYFVDLTGNGCGNNCADFQNFLISNGIYTTSTNNQNTSTSNNNGTTSTSTNTGTGTTTATSTRSNSGGIPNYVQYPYQVYTNFASTDAYYRTQAAASNVYGGTSSNSTGYVQYPYYGYTYFENPASKYDSYLTGSYPEYNYVYYNKDATEQMNKYKKTYTSQSSNTGYGAGYNTSGYGSNNSGNSGFTITSILK